MCVRAEPFDTEQDNRTAIFFGCDAWSESGDSTSEVGQHVAAGKSSSVKGRQHVCLGGAI